MNRRDVLKKFGIGTVIVPILGGVTDNSATAQLIEIPHIKPVELFYKIPEPLDLSKVREAQLMLTMEDGTVRAVSINNLVASPHTIAPDTRLSVEVRFGSPKRDTSPYAYYTYGQIVGSLELL